MRKYYDTTIEKTLHCNRKSLEEMIRCCVGNRKNLEPEKNFDRGKNFFCGQELSKKKNSSEELTKEKILTRPLFT